MKQSRNESCSCGSGLKFKRCCLVTARERMKEEEERRKLAAMQRLAADRERVNTSQPYPRIRFLPSSHSIIFASLAAMLQK